MANIVTMPQIGVSEESAVLVKWYVSVSDKVNVGDKIFALETGKASFDVESEFSGTVLEIICEEGEEKLIKEPVCVIGAEGESYEVAKNNAPKEEIKEEIKAQVAPVKAEVSAKTSSSTDFVGVSPRARQLALESGVDAKLASATGAEGRIIERDVKALISSGVFEKVEVKKEEVSKQEVSSSTEAYKDVKLTNMRKIIADRMHKSLQEMAQLTHNIAFDATNILSYRKTLKQNEKTASITINDIIMFAITRTLKDHPEVNAHFLGDKVRLFDKVNLACAVDTEKGLMVPVIFCASDLSLSQISKNMKELAKSCKEGTISPDLLSGGSITISNLGGFGVESFTPIINAPQVAIIGVCTAVTRVREENGVIKTYPAINLSLTYDHRALDGAPATRFLKDLCTNLENFTSMLAL